MENIMTRANQIRASNFEEKLMIDMPAAVADNLRTELCRYLRVSSCGGDAPQ